MKRSVGRAVASPTERPTHFARRWAAAGVPHWSCRGRTIPDLLILEPDEW